MFVHAIVDPVSIEARSDTSVSAPSGPTPTPKTLVVRARHGRGRPDGRRDHRGADRHRARTPNTPAGTSSPTRSRAALLRRRHSTAESTIDAQTLAKVTGRTGLADPHLRPDRRREPASDRRRTSTRDADRSTGFLDFGGAEPARGHLAHAARPSGRCASSCSASRTRRWSSTRPATSSTSSTCGSATTRATASKTTRSPTPTRPGQLTGTTFTVDDIVYDRGAQARFLANDLSASGRTRRQHGGGLIWGRGGSFEFQQTWDFVTLLNASSLNMVTNIIDVVNSANAPLIDIRVTPSPTTRRAPSPTLLEATGDDLRLRHRVPLPADRWCSSRTRARSSCPVRNPFIRLDDYIENPLGKTRITNASGDILSGTGHELIRTNVLDLDAPQGNIGHQSPTHAEPRPGAQPDRGGARRRTSTPSRTSAAGTVPPRA